MVKSRGFFQSYNKCFISVFLRFCQISFNLARAFAVHRKESFVPALLKVYIDNLFDNLESGKKIIALEKKSLEKVLNFGSKNPYEPWIAYNKTSTLIEL